MTTKKTSTLSSAFILGLGFAQIAHCQPLEEPRPYAGHVVVRAELRDLRDVRTLNALSEDPWTCGWDGVSAGRVDFRLDPEALEALKTTEIPFEVMIPDVQALIDRERAEWRAPAAPLALRGPPPGGGLDATFFADYQPIASIDAGLDHLVTTRPELASKRSLGLSVLQREVFAIKITGPGDSGSRPALFINGCQHAREWIAAASCMYVANALVSRYDSDARVRRLVDGFEWHIVPVANPDGYAFSWTGANRLWRKTRRDNGNGTFGVDSNRNWSVGFGVTGSSSSTNSDIYRGPSAFSEPESRALRDAMLGLPNLLLHVDVHSYGQLILEPRGYTNALPPDAAAYGRVSLAMQDAMFAVAGSAFSPGPIHRNIYPVGGGSVDWVADPTGADAMSMSFELRDIGRFGFVLPADQIVPASEECLEGLLAGAERLLDHRLDVEHVSGPLERVAAGGVTPVEVRVLRGSARPDGAAPVRLRQRIGRTGAWATSTMTAVGADELGTVWQGALAAGACGSVVQYAFELTAADGSTVVAPVNDGVFEVPAQAYIDVYAETFDTPAGLAGWVSGVPTDTAVTGQWVLADPEGTVAQPEFDRTPLGGRVCVHTGFNSRNNETNGDIDSGRTTLTSPLINLAGYADAELSLWVWFSNNRGSTGSDDDELAVDIAANGAAAAPMWTRALTLRTQEPVAQSTGVWRRYDVPVASLIALTSEVRLRIIAADIGAASTVEAAVDDVVVRGLTCAPAPCPGDFDGSGAVSVQDLFEFLSAYFQGRADVNGSGETSVQDIFAFLVDWFTGC